MSLNMRFEGVLQDGFKQIRGVLGSSGENECMMVLNFDIKYFI